MAGHRKELSDFEAWVESLDAFWEPARAAFAGGCKADGEGVEFVKGAKLSAEQKARGWAQAGGALDAMGDAVAGAFLDSFRTGREAAAAAGLLAVKTVETACAAGMFDEALALWSQKAPVSTQNWGGHREALALMSAAAAPGTRAAARARALAKSPWWSLAAQEARKGRHGSMRIQGVCEQANDQVGECLKMAGQSEGSSEAFGSLLSAWGDVFRSSDFAAEEKSAAARSVALAWLDVDWEGSAHPDAARWTLLSLPSHVRSWCAALAPRGTALEEMAARMSARDIEAAWDRGDAQGKEDARAWCARAWGSGSEATLSALAGIFGPAWAGHRGREGFGLQQGAGVGEGFGLLQGRMDGSEPPWMGAAPPKTLDSAAWRSAWPDVFAAVEQARVAWIEAKELRESVDRGQEKTQAPRL